MLNAISQVLSNFNPRSHGGSDYNDTTGNPASLFQSTLPRGERHTCYNYKSSINGFQSTLPRGERRTTGGFFVFLGHFNPRSHGGSDNNSGLQPLATLPISIHAPTGGATVSERRILFSSSFQSTLPRGERRRVRSLRYCGRYFNPRSHGGSDSKSHQI